MKFAKYAVLALALLVPAATLAATAVNGGCGCPCCPIKGTK